MMYQPDFDGSIHAYRRWRNRRVAFYLSTVAILVAMAWLWDQIIRTIGGIK